MQSAFFDVRQTNAAMRWHASRRTAISSPLMFDVFQIEKDNQPGCSQQGSSFNVRLQSGFRRISTGKGRRQVGDDEV
jgi:hypothetical protein